MRLGGPVFVGSDDPEELAQGHRALGYRAGYCPQVKLADAGRIRAVQQAFARHDVVIAEVGVWNNLMDPDQAKRRANVKAVTEGLALAEQVGALCCVNIAGSFHPDNWAGPHPANLSAAAFELAVANAREIIDSVKPRRAKFTYETMPWSVPDSADCYLALIKAVARPAFAVHLDVANLVNSPRRYYDTTALIRECFEKLGPWIVSCHLKDVRLEEELTVHFNEVPPGQGGLDIAAHLLEVARLPHQPPMLLEHLSSPQQYDRARQHVLRIAAELGLDFEH